jgi:hypothetical protein
VQDNLRLLQAMNAFDSDDDSPPSSPPLGGAGRAPGSRAAARRAAAGPGRQGRDRAQQDDCEAPGSLAAKLSDLGRRLLAEIEGSSACGSGGPVAGSAKQAGAGKAAATGAGSLTNKAGPKGAGAGGRGGAVQGRVAVA